MHLQRKPDLITRPEWSQPMAKTAETTFSASAPYNSNRPGAIRNGAEGAHEQCAKVCRRSVSALPGPVKTKRLGIHRHRAPPFVERSLE